MKILVSAAPKARPKPHPRHGRPVSIRRRPRALAIDDDYGMRAAIVITLRAWASFQAVGAANSEEALKLFKRKRFDLVTTDIIRVGESGLDFLRVFKMSHPTVPVVVVSSVLDGTTARRARWLRAFACLRKPFDWRELRAVARAAVASRRSCRTTRLHSRARARRLDAVRQN